MLDAIKRGCQYYYDNIPANTMHTVCKSAIYSFTITFIMVNRLRFDAITKQALPLELTRAYVSAGVAVIASTIYALMTPVFTVAFGDNAIKAHREFIKYFVVAALTYHSTLSIAAFKTYWTAISALDLIPLNSLGAMINLLKDEFKWLDPQIDLTWLENIQNYLGLNPQPGENSAYMTPNFLTY